MPNQPYHIGKIYLECAVCSASIVTTDCHIKRGKRFCSFKCLIKGRDYTAIKENARKMGSANKGKSKPPRSLAHRLKISENMRKRICKDETRMKISLRVKGSHPKVSPEALEARRISFTGPNNPRWKGGVTPILKALRNSKEYVLWRKAIFARDNYTCQICRIRGNQTGGYLEADHIKPFALYPETRFDLSNGRTLCGKCHKLTPTYGNRIKKELRIMRTTTIL